MSIRKKNKETIECGFGENCARRSCTFKHPDSRNIDANLRKIQEKQRQQRIALEQRQMELVRHQCRQGDLCVKSNCLYQHSPAWNPHQNQRLAEEKRRQDELRREKQRQQALNVSNQEDIDNRNEINRNQQRTKSTMSINSSSDDYQYDEQYFHIQTKLWQKQSERQIDKW